MNAVRRLTGGAYDLFVPLVTDQQDVVALAVEPPSLGMHLRHQRARRVDGAQTTRLRFVMHGWRHTMCREDDDGAFRHLVRLLDEHGAERFEASYDVGVVHDLLADIDRCAVALESPLDGQHRAVNAGAVAARTREKHATPGLRDCFGHSTMLRLAVSQPPISGTA